jgi:hypothetical protein
MYGREILIIIGTFACRSDLYDYLRDPSLMLRVTRKKRIVVIAPTLQDSNNMPEPIKPQLERTEIEHISRWVDDSGKIIYEIAKSAVMLNSTTFQFVNELQP